MTPDTRRHLLLLVLAVACLAGLVLQGCTKLEWYQDASFKAADWYRWEVASVIEVECGQSAAFNRHFACARSLPRGIVKRGDVSLATGETWNGEPFVGKLCVVSATLSEEGARRVWPDYDEMFDNMRDHEVIGHCKLGLSHRRK